MTSLFDRLATMHMKDPERFKGFAVKALEYVIEDCKNNPEKWEPIARVTRMNEWNTHDGFLKYLDETVKLATCKMTPPSSFSFLDFHYNEGIISMLWSVLDDLHSMAHYFGRSRICLDREIFGKEIYRAVGR